jgi:hypothetical protein
VIGLICWLQRFQTLAIGLVGFAGVMITLARNARLAREQHDRRVAHDRTVVRVALQAELEALADAYKLRIEQLTEPEQRHDGANFATDEMTAVYRSMIERIGLLSEHQVKAVLKAYLLAEQLPERLKFLAELTGPNSEPGYLYIPKARFILAAKLHRSYLTIIEQAIAALSE